VGSKKRSARAKQIEQFKAQLGGLDDLYGREERRQDEIRERRDDARRERACERKSRYASRVDAEMAIAWCEEQGRRGLTYYRCPYCHGWHLTSHGRD
jgi:hypothetical protein